MGPVDLRDLALFVEVVDTGSITAGAQRRSLSLSAASARVNALERHFGLRLLDRGGRGVTPTPAGELLADQGRGLLEQARELESSMSAHAHGLERRVRLATNNSAADALTEFVASTLNRLPGVAVTMTELSSDAAFEHVRDGLADVAVVSLSTPSVPPPYRTHLLWDDHLVVVGPPTAAPRGPLRLSDLLDGPLVGLLEGNPLQDLVDRHARELGIEPAYRVRLPSLAAVCAVAGTGAGRAVVPRGAVRRHAVPLAAVDVLAEPWAERQATLVTTDLATSDRSVGAFVELLLDHRVAVDTEDRLDGPA